MIKAGDLKHKVVILEPTKVTNSFAEEVDSFQPYCNLWAKIQIDQGREFWAAKKLNSELSGIIWIRYRSDITELMKVQYKNRTFEIIKPPINVADKDEDLEIHLKEVS